MEQTENEQKALFDFDDLLSEETSGRVNIKKNLPKRIATVLDSERSSGLYLQFMRGQISEAEFDEGLDDCVIEYGMTKEEIERYFPPALRHKNRLSFNRTSVIASIIWEERELVGKKRRSGNVRHFWYTNLMYALMKVMRDTNIKGIMSTYGQVLSKLVKYEGFRYSDINLTSNKSELCEALFEDSPYPNVLIACEKESYHDHLKRLANIFRITFISLGGQGSYKVYEDLVVEFINVGIDINQEFHIFTISDFDPQGYCIQDTAKEHLERAGIRKVSIHRVYLCSEHITKGIVARHAVPYVWRKKTSKGNKAALTLYNSFGRRTGGIYKRGDEWRRFSQNGDGSYDVPIFNDSVDGYELNRVELDNFQDEVLLQLLIDALRDFMNGSEYYYKKAQDYVDELFHEKWRESSDKIVSEKVEDFLGDEYSLLYDLEHQLRQRSLEFTSDVDNLEKDIESDYNYRYGLIEEEIEGLYEEISRLESQQNDLRALHYAIRSILRSIWEAKRKELTELETELETKIKDVLSGYKILAQEAMKDDIYQKMRENGFSVRAWVDFMEKQDVIFDEARKGVEAFEVELDLITKAALKIRLDDELERRKEDLIDDESIFMPELPEEVSNIREVAKDIENILEDVEEGELSEEQERLLRTLCYLFHDADGFELGCLWKTDDLYDFLERCAEGENNNEQ